MLVETEGESCPRDAPGGPHVGDEVLRAARETHDAVFQLRNEKTTVARRDGKGKIGSEKGRGR
jgi:hypothetical protein